MSYGMYLSAAGAEVQNQRLQIISNNLANVGTPGFKRELAMVQARHSEAIEQGLDRQGSRSINDVGGGVRVHETLTEFGPGDVRKTDIPTDVAINDRDPRNPAFFVVERDGKEYLTRAGNFQFAPSGELQTQQGFRVLSVTGDPVVRDPGLPPIVQFTEQGVLRQAGIDINALQLVRPASLGDLVRSGENLFSPLADVEPVPPAERHVSGGYLESSSVSPYREMLQMIEASRAYESNVRLIQHQDNMLGTLVNRVLRQQ
jgi:flagellar basal-body rod protein FlgF/flagellar basal-body rod protein FlgG